MTTLLSAHALQLESNDDLLFQDITFTLKLGDRIGLIGHNGCGKSTLLNLLSAAAAPACAGPAIASSATASATASAGPGVPQPVAASPDSALPHRAGAPALEASAGKLHIARACRMQHVEQHLPPLLTGLSLYHALLQPVAGQPELHWRVDSLLAQLGIDAATAQVPVHSLSGGQHTRLLLGRALLQEPNLLLLDEPSNHLDLPSLLWLEQFLSGWRGAFVLVSHDQRLLDNVTRKSWILRDQRLYTFDLACADALLALAEQDAAASARRAAEQKEIDRLAASSQRLAIWGKTYDNEDLARKAKTMQRRVDKLKQAQSFVTQGPPWRLALHGKALAAKQLLALDQLPVQPCAGGPLLFCVDQLWLKPGDKIALLGANGSGKSSLLRMCWQAVVSQLDTAGLYFHPAAQIGYYDQSLQQLPDSADLAAALYPFAALSDLVQQRTESARRQALISAGFPYSRHQQTVATLSGGERARLLFLALSLASYHLLFLDEPTNHLDMQGKGELATALQGFEGGCLLVSHDRDLVEQACNRFWVVVDGRIEEWPDAPAAYQRLFSGAGHEAAASSASPDGKRAAALAMGAQGSGRLAQAPAAAADDGEQERQLEQLLELEQLLADDLARKPRHQKPHLQQQWRAEMAALNQCLGLWETA